MVLNTFMRSLRAAEHLKILMGGEGGGGDSAPESIQPKTLPLKPDEEDQEGNKNGDVDRHRNFTDRQNFSNSYRRMLSTKCF